MPDHSSVTSPFFIDWWLVLSTGLWILGFAIILAAASFHCWRAGEEGRTLRQQFGDTSWSVALAAGLFLACMGFSLGPDAARWERALWTALSLSFAWQSASAVSENRRARLRAAASPNENTEA